MSTLSVIIPTYNRPEFVVKCVESLRHCGVDDLEIMVVDDGSTDNTREVLAGLADCHYIYQENRGPAAARNNGFSQCTGRFVAFVDSDDYWLPGAAAPVIEQFERHPEVDVIFSDARMGNAADGYESWIEVAGEQTFRELPSVDAADGFRILERSAFWRRMIVRNAVFISAVIMRREAFEKAGQFDPALCGAADWELWLRMAGEQQFGYSPQALAIYTRHGDCMSNDHDEMRSDFIRTLKKIRQHGTYLNDQDQALVTSQLLHHLFGHAYSAYDRGDLQLARKRFNCLSREEALSVRQQLLRIATYLPPPLLKALRWTKSALRV